MRRREFITLLGSIAAVSSFAASAQQQPKLPTVGFFRAGTPDYWASLVAAFREGLSNAGYVDRRNVALTLRFAEDHYDRLPAMALDLVRQGVDVICAGGDGSLDAALAATNTIPIVAIFGNDPVAAGYIKSLSRPGGNVTGATFLPGRLDAKRIELLHEIDPKAASVAVLSPKRTGPQGLEHARIESEIEGAAKSFGLSVRFVTIESEDDVIPAFKDIAAHREDAVHIMSDAFLGLHSHELAVLAAQAGLPAIGNVRRFPAAGGLLSYGASAESAYRTVGTYVGRILKGEKPADLPVQESTKIELIINLKTARALRLTVPLSVLARADEVIE